MILNGIPSAILEQKTYEKIMILFCPNKIRTCIVTLTTHYNVVPRISRFINFYHYKYNNIIKVVNTYC